MAESHVAASHSQDVGGSTARTPVHVLQDGCRCIYPGVDSQEYPLPADLARQ